MRVPDSLAWWGSRPGGARWLAHLPAIVDDCAARWRLRVEGPLDGGDVSLVVRVWRDGSPAVLKVSFPEPESEHEAAALGVWAGSGAVSLLEHDPEARALLVEWCEPGTRLWESPEDEATATVADVLVALHSAVPDDTPFQRLAAVSDGWAETLQRAGERGRCPFARTLLDEAVATCRELGPGGPNVLLHQDLHGGNVLRAERGWLAVDPKPLVGDAAFDAASYLRDRRWLLGGADDLERIRRRLDLLAERTGLDRTRMRGWGIVHALGWGHGPEGWDAAMVQCAELLHRA